MTPRAEASQLNPWFVLFFHQMGIYIYRANKRNNEGPKRPNLVGLEALPQAAHPPGCSTPFATQLIPNCFFHIELLFQHVFSTDMSFAQQNVI